MLSSSSHKCTPLHSYMSGFNVYISKPKRYQRQRRYDDGLSIHFKCLAAVICIYIMYTISFLPGHALGVAKDIGVWAPMSPPLKIIPNFKAYKFIVIKIHRKNLCTKFLLCEKKKMLLMTETLYMNTK